MKKSKNILMKTIKVTYQDIIDEFGTPNEVAGSYIENLETEFICRQLNKKKIS